MFEANPKHHCAVATEKAADWQLELGQVLDAKEAIFFHPRASMFIATKGIGGSSQAPHATAFGTGSKMKCVETHKV